MNEKSDVGFEKNIVGMTSNDPKERLFGQTYLWVIEGGLT